MFSSIQSNIYVLANGMGKTRANFFNDALVKNNANVLEEKYFKNFDFNNARILIIVDTNFNEWDVLEKIIYKKIDKVTNLQENVALIKSSWITECLKQKSCIDYSNYEIKKNINEEKNETAQESLTDQENNMKVIKTNSKLKRALSNDDTLELIIKKKITNNNKPSTSYIESDSEFESSDNSDAEEYSSEDNLNEKNENKPKVSKSYICTHSSKEQKVNLNKDITDKLEGLCSIYEKTKDKYRALGYQKAIQALRVHPKRVTTWEEAKSVRGVGKRLADKIFEIIQTGELQKLDEFNSREDLNSISLFTNIHGVGPTTAQMFVAQGFRTLEDLKSNANLNKQQIIGLKYYEEFLNRIPRDEVMEIEKIVKDAALNINPDLIVQTCGSYRRNKATCGDVDILVTHPDGHSHKGVFHKLINLLHDQNFLTDDLVSHEEDGKHTKYFGVCCLPGNNRLHRRLDIIVVPFDEYATALLYFTGSAHFNRSMRLLCRKMGLSLSEHSLNKNVVRKGTEKINNGEIIPTPNEESIFKYLNLTYRTPEERDF